MSESRHSKLLMLLLSQGQMSVQEISTALEASLATVRRDLLELEHSGQIERLHGAARIATGSHRELAFSAREQTQIAAKRAIAGRAAAFIQPNKSAFLDAGTTVLQVARHIRSFEMPMNIFTNGLVIAQELAHVSNISVTLIGGRVRAENQSMVGPAAISMLSSFWFDTLFLGATSIDDEGNLTSLDADEAATNAQMIRRSKKLVVLADNSKFARRSTFAVGRLTQGDLLITDVAPEGEFAQYLQDTDVSVILAKAASHE